MRNARTHACTHIHMNILIAYIFRILDSNFFPSVLSGVRAQYACRWSNSKDGKCREEKLNFSSRAVALGCIFVPFHLSFFLFFFFSCSTSLLSFSLLYRLLYYYEGNENGVNGCGDVAVSIPHFCYVLLILLCIKLPNPIEHEHIPALFISNSISLSLFLFIFCSLFLPLVPFSDSCEFFVCLLRFFFTFFVVDVVYLFVFCFQSIL